MPALATTRARCPHRRDQARSSQQQQHRKVGQRPHDFGPTGSMARSPLSERDRALGGRGRVRLATGSNGPPEGAQGPKPCRFGPKTAEIGPTRDASFLPICRRNVLLAYKCGTASGAEGAGSNPAGRASVPGPDGVLQHRPGLDQDPGDLHLRDAQDAGDRLLA
jgi:hypothetical protein